MEVKPGYNLTEIGVIPEDWGVDYVSNHCSITTGKRNTQDNVINGLYPFFVRSKEVERINSYSFDGEAVLTAGDGVGTGKVFHYINGRFDYHQRVYCLSNFSQAIDGYYFFLFFQSRFYARIMQFTAKTSVDSVRLKMITNMPIALPPIREQKAIAEVISGINDLITSLEKLIEKKKLIKQGMMQEMLTGERRLSGFNGEWVKTTIDECFTVLRGSGLSKAHLTPDGANSCILYGELFTTYNDVIDVVYSSTNSHRGVDSRAGDILLPGSTTTTGVDLAKASALLQDNVSLGGDINILRPKRELDSAFLAMYLNVVRRKEIARETKGITIYHLQGGDIKNIIIELPDLSEQVAISTIIGTTDCEIRSLEKQLRKYALLKKAMMQELLTGRIRLL